MAVAPGLSVVLAEKRFVGTAVPLLADFRLAVAPGEVVALMGPSGVGKSTLLRLIAGIDADFVGAIHVGGDVAVAAPAPGFVFQDARLLPWLSVLDNVRLAAPHAPVEDLVAHLDAVGLSTRSQDFPGQLSGGMQRRVALARALASGSRLWLLDEAFTSLDMALAAEMHDLVGRLVAATGPTVVLATHSAAEAVRLAQRVIVLSGRPARIAAEIVVASDDAAGTVARIQANLNGQPMRPPSSSST